MSTTLVRGGGRVHRSSLPLQPASGLSCCAARRRRGVNRRCRLPELGSSSRELSHRPSNISRARRLHYSARCRHISAGLAVHHSSSSVPRSSTMAAPYTRTLSASRPRLSSNDLLPGSLLSNSSRTHVHPHSSSNSISTAVRPRMVSTSRAARADDLSCHRRPGRATMAGATFRSRCTNRRPPQLGLARAPRPAF